jgi:alpha-N-acetylglucosamine transferase
MLLVSRENRLVRAEAIIPQRSEEKVLDMTKTVHTLTILMCKLGVWNMTRFEKLVEIPR